MQKRHKLVFKNAPECNEVLTVKISRLNMSPPWHGVLKWNLLLLTVVTVTIKVSVEVLEEQVSVNIKRIFEKYRHEVVSDCSIGHVVIDLLCSLRLPLLVGVISYRGWTYTAPALPVPPPAAAPPASETRAQPTAGTYRVTYPQCTSNTHTNLSSRMCHKWI